MCRRGAGGVTRMIFRMNFMIPKKHKAMLKGIYFSKDMILRINLGGETNHPITFAVTYNPMILRINLGGETNHPITFAVAYNPSNSTQVGPIILRGKSAIYIKLKVVCRWGVPVNRNGLTGDIITGMIRGSNPHIGFLQFVTIDYPPAPYLQFLEINGYNCLTGPSSRARKRWRRHGGESMVAELSLSSSTITVVGVGKDGGGGGDWRIHVTIIPNNWNCPQTQPPLLPPIPKTSLPPLSPPALLNLISSIFPAISSALFFLAIVLIFVAALLKKIKALISSHAQLAQVLRRSTNLKLTSVLNQYFVAVDLLCLLDEMSDLYNYTIEGHSKVVSIVK
ncbi:hypothetical protein KY290_036340 [Solanum tuberosum]|uniref:Uncharacterized protein n=1 Tax=Solanum tuberosum TaxID=4113 RepID=A0ABQ7TSW0_SOLTU|nr:hypothetical protein KY289_037847 [Solanum tuberosum]KAH0639041.1 hypothetical protein KY285_035627 [Solanum tuberosum]KAH0737635.1 hypothetical protein KY290_036340 [Solanum tuberosum]